MSKHQDFPLTEVATACDSLIKRGSFILQKWTCDGCGQRVTAQNINVLCQHGHCQHCGRVTDLTVKGCNYALIQSSRNLTVAELEQMLGLAAPGMH